MRIAIIGSGAMGSLFGGYLSQHNELWLIDVNAARIEAIRREGVCIDEPDGTRRFTPHAVTQSDGLPVMDLIIVFVKAMCTDDALAGNRNLIGPESRLMTLQNGTGHEERLLRFVDAERVLIGTTQHNGSLLENGHVHHGGGGSTFIGVLCGDSARVQHIADNFTRCGFRTECSDEVKRLIWKKLFLNTSASVLTGILQVPLGFILDDPHAAGMMRRLVEEAVCVANAEGGYGFCPNEVLEEICASLRNSRGGHTSIYTDIRRGARTEVDTISGSVARKGRALNVPVPYHEMAVSLIHALEGKAAAEAAGMLGGTV